MASAVVEAAALACGSGDEAEVTAQAQVTAEALADVYAHAFAGIDIYCEAEGPFAWACASGEVFAQAHAEATGRCAPNMYC